MNKDTTEPKKEKNPHNIEMGKRLRLVRKAADKTQDQLGQDLGLSKDTIRDYESGRNPLTLENAFAVAKKYNVSLDWLLCLEPNAKSVYFAIQDKLAITTEPLKLKDPTLHTAHTKSLHCLTLKADSRFINFLIALSKAEKNKNIPELYNEGIREAEQVYNEVSAGEPFPVEYYLAAATEKTYAELDENGDEIARHYIEWYL